MKVATLRVDMSNGHGRADRNVSISVMHFLSLQGVLELGAHKRISISRVAENGKVDFEHGHVEEQGDSDQANGTGDKVSHPKRCRNVEIAQQGPQLLNGRGTNRRNGKQSNPFAADNGTKGKASKEEICPPDSGKRTRDDNALCTMDGGCLVLRSLVLVAEHDPEHDAETGKEEERTVEEDVSTLGDEAVFENDENAPEERGRCGTVECTESEVCNGDEENTEDGGDHSHEDIGDRVWIGHANFLEIKFSCKSSDPCSEREQKFCEWRMNVDIVSRPYIFPRKLSEMDLVEYDAVGFADAEETNGACDEQDGNENLPFS